MSEVLHANIFFFIASVGVITLSILAGVLLYHLIKIVRSVQRIVERVEAGSQVIAEDIENVRENLNLANFVSLVLSFIPGAKTPRPRRNKKSSEQ